MRPRLDARFTAALLLLGPAAAEAHGSGLAFMARHLMIWWVLVPATALLALPGRRIRMTLLALVGYPLWFYTTLFAVGLFRFGHSRDEEQVWNAVAIAGAVAWAGWLAMLRLRGRSER